MRTTPRHALSPPAAALLAATMSRRSLLRGGVTSGALLALGACGTPGTRQTEQSCVSEDLSTTEKTLAFANWPQYLDVDPDNESKHPTLDAFSRRTGITVSYSEEINDNNQFFGKVQHQLAACQPTGRDIVVLTDWLVGRLIKLGWVQRLDPAMLPNVTSNLLPTLRGRSIDPTNGYAVPWQGGLTGLAYHGGRTSEIRTVDELLTRADLKGRVTLLKEMRDTIGLLLQSNGHDPTNFTNAHFDQALEKLRKAVASGQIRRFTGNDYAPDLQRGGVVACLAWSCGGLPPNAENPKIRFVAPESGLLIYSDDMVVPNRATHKANAEQLMNYYYDPRVAAELAAFVNYICPVAGARSEMEKIDPDLAENPLIFPTSDLLAVAKDFMALDDAKQRSYEQKFQAVIGA
jgi:spermidine/putrescine transport system substrate-binding protein